VLAEAGNRRVEVLTYHDPALVAAEPGTPAIVGDGAQLGDGPAPPRDAVDLPASPTWRRRSLLSGFCSARVKCRQGPWAILLHYTGTAWEDVTTSRDLAAQVICGRVTSLSPFVIGNGATGVETIRSGFYQPVNSEAGYLNTVKGGSTVPLKFEVTVDGVEKTDTAGLVFTVSQVACEGGAEDPVDFVVAGSTSLRYDAEEGVFVQNWKTPKTTGTCYVVRLTTESDGQSLQATFKTK
jgi:hypothetical protein